MPDIPSEWKMSRGVADSFKATASVLYGNDIVTDDDLVAALKATGVVPDWASVTIYEDDDCGMVPLEEDRVVECSFCGLGTTFPAGTLAPPDDAEAEFYCSDCISTTKEAS